MYIDPIPLPNSETWLPLPKVDFLEELEKGCYLLKERACFADAKSQTHLANYLREQFVNFNKKLEEIRKRGSDWEVSYLVLKNRLENLNGIMSHAYETYSQLDLEEDVERDLLEQLGLIAQNHSDTSEPEVSVYADYPPLTVDEMALLEDFDSLLSQEDWSKIIGLDSNDGTGSDEASESVESCGPASPNTSQRKNLDQPDTSTQLNKNHIPSSPESSTTNIEEFKLIEIPSSSASPSSCFSFSTDQGTSDESSSLDRLPIDSPLPKRRRSERILEMDKAQSNRNVQAAEANSQVSSKKQRKGQNEGKKAGKWREPREGSRKSPRLAELKRLHA